MLDLKFVRENPEVVKQNIRNKFQDDKLPLVDEVIELDAQRRATQQEADDLRSNRKKISKQIGALMAQGKKEEADAVKEQVTKNAERLAELEKLEAELGEKVKKILMIIPISLTQVFQLVKMIVKTLRFRSMVNHLFLSLKFHTIQILWKDSTELIWMQLVRLLVTVSIILWVILQDFIQQLSHMQEIS